MNACLFRSIRNEKASDRVQIVLLPGWMLIVVVCGYLYYNMCNRYYLHQRPQKLQLRIMTFVSVILGGYKAPIGGQKKRGKGKKKGKEKKGERKF